MMEKVVSVISALKDSHTEHTTANKWETVEGYQIEFTMLHNKKMSPSFSCFRTIGTIKLVSIQLVCVKI